jgi:hypothetical protein
MEPNNFDDGIKEKLEGRRLQPSDEAWTKLSERLIYEDKKDNNKTIWWAGFAASVIGILFVAFQFFNNPLEVKPVIVDAPTVIEQNERVPIAVGNAEASNEVLEVTQPIEKTEKFQLKENSSNNIKSDPIVIASEQVIPKEKSQEKKPIKVLQEDFTFEAQKIQDVVAQVQMLKDNNQELTDDVIDAMLLEAQKEIRLKQLNNQVTGVVDANMLLQDVENDLDQSFRSKVFEALKASYGTVKTAVAQRNN